MAHSSRPRSAEELEDTLRRIDGLGYPAYRDLLGAWTLRTHSNGSPRLVLHVDRVQADPYAPPSLMRVAVDAGTAALPQNLIADRPGRVATADHILRAVARDLAQESAGISTGSPTQEIIERSGVVVTDHGVEARLSVALPADRRRILGRRADHLLLDVLPNAVGLHLRADGLDLEALREHVDAYRDQLDLQALLPQHGLIGFIPDGAILPRAAGDSDLPLSVGVPFRSPESLRVTLELPSGRRLAGLGIRTGVTVIIGGGFHGKSTLLSALTRGVHPHIEGDGREFVLSVPDAVAIRAEDGRSVTDVDISPFIGALPSGADTHHFSTPNASGSTSQAAAIVEAREAGSTTLLLDEDTCATNFMMRDDVMRRLVTAEPITPFVERIDQLTAAGVSTVLVAGGSSAFLPHAATVISMDAYVPQDVTDAAHAATQGAATECPTAGGADPLPRRVSRALARDGLAPVTPHGKRPRPPAAKGRGLIRMGEASLDATATGVVDQEQTEGVARALARLEADAGSGTLAQDVGHLEDQLSREGLAALIAGQQHPGQVGLPRAVDVAAAANRYRHLRIQP
ncbi:MAG: P-loop domain-containing protein [Galactobacter sp.]